MTEPSLCKKILLVFSALLIAGCSKLPKTDTVPGTGMVDFVHVKFSGKVRDQRQRGKIILSLEHSRSRLLLLSPLNRVYFKMLVDAENTVLINLQKKRYWTGGFQEMLVRLWGLNLHFGELRNLLLSDSPDLAELKKRGIHVTFTGYERTGRVSGFALAYKDSRMRMKVIRRSRRAGTLPGKENLAGLTKTDLAGVFENQE